MTANRLLIVDDNKAVGELVREVVAGAGREVQVTSSGRAFKLRYDTFKPDTVIIDLVMPDIDGIELVQWVAAHETPARVIVATGYSPEYASLAKKLGEARGLAPVTTLIKPIKPNRLRRVLDELEDETDPDRPGSADSDTDLDTDH